MFFNIENYFNCCILIHKDCIIESLGDIKTNKKQSLTYALNLNYFNEANKNENVSTIIVTQEIADYIGKTTKNLVIEKFPKIAFWRLHNYLVENEIMKLPQENHIDKSAKIHSSVIIKDNVWIGKNVCIDAGSIILSNSIIKENAHIHSGVIIGSDGMQVIKDENGNQIFIRHAGGVIIGKNVNVLSGANISKAVDLSYTTIGENSVVSIHASVGHNVKIGKNCMLAGNVLVGGSTTIKDNVWIGPSSTIKDSITIDNNVSIKIGSVVVKDVKDGEEVSGNFAYNHTKRIRNFVKEQR